ncbi:VWA domain-containing protein [Planktotalea sp.]|uniref:VWA domain-containing protein n=1 Tax=Planktotalea sp. TaxID=2029877 RepID=UPI003298375C
MMNVFRTLPPVLSRATLALVVSSTMAMAAPVITNGDFEQNPPSSYGNNIGWSIAPWTLTGNDQANVVQVDGPGGQTSYGSNGPASDATGGTGNQHYLDIVGSNELYQEFTPQCDGLVQFGASFSSRGNASGSASVSILDATGSNTVAGPAAASFAGGTSETDPWTPVTGTATLSAGTTYRLQITMSNPTNVDNAFVEFEDFCPAHNDDDVPPEPPEETEEDTTDIEPQACVPFVAEVSCDPNTHETLVTLSNALSGEFDPSHVQISSNTSGVSVAQRGPMSVALTGASAGQTILISTASVEIGGGSAEGLDACCMGEMEIVIPETLECKAPTLEVEKTCETSASSPAPYQCEITVHYSGPPPSADTPITLTENLTGGTFLPSSSGPMMTDPWNCDADQGAANDMIACEITADDAPDADWSDWTSSLIVEVEGEETGFENCVSVDAGPTLADEACWSQETPEPEDISIEKTCEHVENGLLNPIVFDCSITVTTNGAPFDGDLTITDTLDWGSTLPFPPIINDVSSQDAWNCETPPGGDPAVPQCSISNDDFPHTAGSSTVDIEFWFHDHYPEENCASVSLGDQGELATVCTELTIDEDDDTPPLPDPDPSYELVKSCENVGNDIACVITLTTNGVAFLGDITVSDVSNLSSTPGATITGPAGATCNNTSMSCAISHATLSGLTPPNSAVFNVTFPNTEMPEGFMNCAVGDHANMPEARDCVLENGEFDTPDEAPEQAASCSSDVVFVVDTSASLGSSASTVMQSLRNMAGVFEGDGSQAALVTFGSSATVQLPMSTASLTTLANSTQTPTAAGGTNWEDALVKAGTVITPNSVVIFITDGRPTAHLDASGVSTNVPNSPSGWLTATNEAIPAVNAIYSAGVPIIGVGISDSQGVFVSTYLDALLGTTSTGTTFNSLNQTLGSIANEICGDMYLEKYMNPSFVNFANETGTTKRVTVTLRAQNFTNSAANSVVIKDKVPTELSAIGNTTASHGSATITGQDVVWTIPTLADTVTAVLTFQADLTAPPEGTTNWQCNENFAQVMSLNGTMQSIPGNMNEVSGPVAEDDEAKRRFCVKNEPDVTNPPQACTPYLRVDKVLDISEQEVCFAGQPCTFQIKVRSSCPNDDFDMPVQLGDIVSGANGATPTVITSMSNDSSPAVCAFPSAWSSNTTSTQCSTPSLQIPAGDTVTFDVTMTAPSTPGSYTNCFSALEGSPPATGTASVSLPNIYRDRGDCAPFEVVSSTRSAEQLIPTEQAPELELVKSQSGQCRVNVGSQTYACDFELQLTNTGQSEVTSPVTLSDTFGTPAPTAITNVTGDGWSCASKYSGSASCLHAGLTLAPMQSATVGMTLTLPGLPKGGSFENCAAIGISDNPYERAVTLQTIMTERGINVGKIDGVPGRRTRAGLRTLQAELGLPETGKIDDALVDALGLASADAPASCVTAELPIMPPPPLVCDAKSTQLLDGSCECRYKNMYQRDKTSCGCIKGTQFVEGEGCIKRKITPQQSKPKALSCNSATAVKRGGECVCRYSKMRKANSTSCRCIAGTEFVAGEGCVVIRREPTAPARCENGLPRIPGVGCIDIKRGEGKPRIKNEADRPDAPSVDPDQI